MQVLLAQTMAAAAVDPQAAVANEFLKNGVLGALVVVLGMTIIVLWRDNKAERAAKEAALTNLHSAKEIALGILHNERVADAKAYSAQLLRLNESVVQTLTQITGSLEAQRERDGDLKDSFEKLTERLPTRR